VKLLVFILPLLLFACAGSEEQEASTSPNDTEIESDSLVTEDGVSEFFWNFEGDFTETQQDTLKAWQLEMQKAVYYTLGDYPFDVNVFFHPSNRKTSSVSFGHTTRKELVEVHYYVNPDASLDALLGDWTSPHELSHLSAPFFGKSRKWLGEGYATYLSRRIMVDMGIFTEEEFEEMYSRKINDTREFYDDTEKTFSEVSANLFEEYHYGTVYWGGAGYFYIADKQLQEKHNMRFTEVVQEYQKCCRLEDKNFGDILNSWDSIIDDTLFSDLLSKYEDGPAVKVWDLFD